jgi:hypothetical protein
VIDRNGQRFYTAADTHMGKVREAMRKVGDDLMRAQFPEDYEPRRGHQYGPHAPDDAPQLVEVYPPGKWPKIVKVPIAPALLKQRARINHRAHEDAKR